MVKTRTKAKEEEVEEIDESYYSESDEASSEKLQDMREIDQQNIGNYKSDSDDEDLDSDEDIGQNL